MRYDFDEMIDRRKTNSENVEGFRAYMFPDDPDLKLPVADDELIRMWVADMDFAVAPEICDAIRARVDRKILGYTGVFDNSYYDAFADWCRQRYGWEFPREQLVFSQGVVPALYELVEDITEPGDKVLFLSPSYGPFKHACRRSGRVPVVSPVVGTEDGFTVDMEDFETKASDPDVKLVIWCNPHNPTGRVWSEEEAQAVAGTVERNGLWIISDEIHCDLTRKGQRHVPMGKVMPDYEKLVTCMAASKTFNLAGTMFSNIIIRDEALRKTFVRNDKLGGMVNPLSLEACRAAYEKGGPWLHELREYLDGNFAFAVDFIRENMPGAVCHIPQATYLLWVDMRRCLPDIASPSGGSGVSGSSGSSGSSGGGGLSRFFAEKAGVLVESGNRLFVDNAEGFVRINLATPRAVVREGLARMAKAVADHQQEERR